MRRHDFDTFSFIFGLFFAVAGLVLLGGSASRDGLAIPWAGPVVAIGLAILIVVAARPRGERAATEIDPESVATDPPDAA